MTDPEDSQESLLRFLYQVPMAITQLDNEGMIRLINPFAAQLLMPLCPNSRLENLFEILTPWIPGIRKRFNEELRPGPVITQEAVEVKNGDHTQFLSVTLNRLSEDEGVLILEDITAQHQLQQQVEEEQRKGEFLRGRQEATSAVLHDIGNAITSIGVNTSGFFAEEGWEEIRLLGRIHDLLEQEQASLAQSLGETKAGALLTLTHDIHSELGARHDRIRDTAKRVATSIHHIGEILSIQRRQSQSGETQHGRVLFLQLVEDAITLQQSALDRRGIHIQSDLSPSLPPLKVDPTRLTRVILNLLKNALESYDRMDTRPENPLLQIRLSSTDGFQILELQDSASGFAPEKAETYFEKRTSEKKEKSGIGLYSCRKMIEGEGGTLHLSCPGPGQGATAILKLPIHEPLCAHE